MDKVLNLSAFGEIIKDPSKKQTLAFGEPADKETLPKRQRPKHQLEFLKELIDAKHDEL